MKRFAYQFLNGNYEMTNVWRVRRIKHEQPHLFDKLDFYSTHKKIENRKKMTFVESKPNNYFRYKNSGGCTSHEGHDVTLTHEICQDIISELEVLIFKIGKDVYKIYVSDCEVEKEIKTVNGNYYVDVFVEFNKSEPETLVTQWNGKVAIEIHVTNKVSPAKVKDLHDMGIPIIEISVSDKLKIDETREITEEEMINKKNYIAKYYREVIYARILKKYDSKEYLEMKEIEELKSRILSLENQINHKDDELSRLHAQVNQIKAENGRLKQQKIDSEKSLQSLSTEIIELKQSFWYKLSRLIKK